MVLKAFLECLDFDFKKQSLKGSERDRNEIAFLWSDGLNLNGEITIVSPSEVAYMISEAVLNVEIATHTRSQQTLSKFREQYSRFYHVQSR